MRKTFVTSDTHFGHQNIMEYCPATRARFQRDVVYMTEAMINDWNDLIAPTDLVYHLGDVAFMPSQKAADTVNRLNGIKILVEGNHDHKALKDPVFRACFAEVHKYLEIKYDGTKVVMFHYPVAEFNQQHRGAVHLHGHLHGVPSGVEHFRVLDVGVDATGMIAITMEDAISRAMGGEIKQPHRPS